MLDGADLDEHYLSGPDDGPANWDDIDLEDAFDLPPVLPAPDKMTPNDLVLVWIHGSDDDLEAELASWTDSRGEEQAARDLLAFAADGKAATRTAAITIVSRLGQATEPAWREALDRVELRCYAKPQLVKLAGLDPEGTDLPAELQPERADIAWLIAGPRTRHPPAEPPAVSAAARSGAGTSHWRGHRLHRPAALRTHAAPPRV